MPETDYVRRDSGSDGHEACITPVIDPSCRFPRTDFSFRAIEYTIQPNRILDLIYSSHRIYFQFHSAFSSADLLIISDITLNKFNKESLGQTSKKAITASSESRSGSALGNKPLR